MKWEIENSSIVHHDKWLKVRADKCKMPGGQVVDPYYVLEYPNWVNVFGITTEEEVVLVKMYRHGIQRTVTELPCGIIDDSDKSPLHAAKRELLEETGYSSENFTQTGVVSPNPANHNNLAYCFLARDLELIDTPQLDSTEEVDTLLVPIKEVIKMLESGQFLQALHVSSIYYAMNFLNKNN